MLFKLRIPGAILQCLIKPVNSPSCLCDLICVSRVDLLHPGSLKSNNLEIFPLKPVFDGKKNILSFKPLFPGGGKGDFMHPHSLIEWDKTRRWDVAIPIVNSVVKVMTSCHTTDFLFPRWWLSAHLLLNPLQLLRLRGCSLYLLVYSTIAVVKMLHFVPAGML